MIQTNIPRYAILLLLLFGQTIHAEDQQDSSSVVMSEEKDLFPDELVKFSPWKGNPVFEASGPSGWDIKIRERGWILKESDGYHLWYTGFDGTRPGIKNLGYATSKDGIHWKKQTDHPILPDLWIEDMMVVKNEGKYYMFAEGIKDHAQLLTSTDKVHWKPEGVLDIRYTDGSPLTPGPFGTPTAWYENGTWYLFYERRDQGVWLATSKDMKVWTNLQDDPVLVPGPGPYDAGMIAMNQIIKYEGCYYACYHGKGKESPYDTWCSCLAVSDDLIHWTKYPGNPLLKENKSSNLLIREGKKFRLYSMHDEVHLHLPK